MVWKSEPALQVVDYRFGGEHLDDVVIPGVSVVGNVVVVRQSRHGLDGPLQPLSCRRSDGLVSERSGPERVRGEDHFGELADEVIKRVLCGLGWAAECRLGQRASEGNKEQPRSIVVAADSKFE